MLNSLMIGLVLVLATYLCWLIGAVIVGCFASDWDMLIMALPFCHWIAFNKYIKKNCRPRFSYKQIMTFESIAPQKWRARNVSDGSFFWLIEYDNESIGVKNIFDYWKTVHYFKEREKIIKRKLKPTVDENTAAILIKLQEDISNIQNKK